MKTVIFGASELGVNFYFEIREAEEVVAFIDNDAEKQDKEILGIKILPAEALPSLEFDRIHIASIYHFKVIESQIKSLGISQDKISFLPAQTDRQKRASDMLYQFQEIYRNRQEEYDKKWKQIRKQHESVKVYGLYADTFGELIMQFFMIQGTCEESSTLRIFVPETVSVKRICNKYLLELLGRKIHIVQEEDAEFWAYVIKKYLDDLDVLEYDKYKTRNEYQAYKAVGGDCKQWFHDDEIECGKMALAEMGLNKPYVCLAARTAAYNQKTMGHDCSYDFRNMVFDAYGMAISYLKKQNIAVVKMGRMEEPMKLPVGCIDYAGVYADDFMDLYLASECEFMISCLSGVVLAASLFFKPILVINVVTVSYGCGGIRYTDKDLYIPKKYYDVNKGRCLSFREMAEAELKCQCLLDGELYEKMGIKFIDNTAEEIEAAVQEMLDRLSGKWQDTEEDQKNYEKYLEIYHEVGRKRTTRNHSWIDEPIPYRIAATYLRDNLYLLA